MLTYGRRSSYFAARRDDERSQKLAARPLQREDRLALRKRRALAFGDLAEVFAQAREEDDDELLSLLWSRRLKGSCIWPFVRLPNGRKVSRVIVHCVTLRRVRLARRAGVSSNHPRASRSPISDSIGLASSASRPILVNSSRDILERTVRFMKNDWLSVVLDDYISLLNRVGQVGMLWRIYAALTEFGTLG